jgi:oxygen-dependent protoporphyrinogen oxidase
MPWDDIYALATPKRSFNMMFNHANVLRARSESREPGGSLMLYSGGRLARTLLDRSDGEVVDTYLADLYDIYPRLKGHVREAVVQRWEQALPFPTPGRSGLQDALQRDLGEANILLAGDYLGTWYTETAAATGREAGHAIKTLLSAEESGR